MADTKNVDVVYLEDLENVKPSPAPPSSAPEPASTPPAPLAPGAAPASNSAASPAATVAVKRQRTLVDMFASAPSSASKKPRLENKAAAAASSSAASSATAARPRVQPLNAIPFSLSAYQAALSDDQKRLLALECVTMGKSWLKILKDEIRKPYFITLKTFLWEEGVKGPDDSSKSPKVYPSPRDIYAWSNLTPLGRVKVVIIGQDPYHGPGQAHGLCFSVPPGVPVPPSLRNIYAEIRAEYPAFEPPSHGNLAAWAADGVLLLNTCLTVRAGHAGSHSGRGWEAFTDTVVDAVDRYGGANLAHAAGRGRGVVFLAWGAWAAKRVAKLDKNKHLILTSAHPSPLSAHRGFLGNGHFKQANEWLAARYGEDGCVEWCRL